MKSIFNTILAMSIVASSHAMAGGIPLSSNLASNSVQNTAVSIINEKKAEVDADLAKLDALDVLLTKAQVQRTSSKTTLIIAGGGLLASALYLVVGTAFSESSTTITGLFDSPFVSKHYSPIPLMIGGTLMVISTIYAFKGGFKMVVSNAEYSNLLREKETVRTKLEIKQKQLGLLRVGPGR